MSTKVGTPADPTVVGSGAGGSSGAAGDRRASAITPTLRSRLRSWRFWIVVAIAVVAAVGVSSLFNAAGRDTTVFGPENAGPTGARALVEVLRQQGVEVIPVGSLDEALAASADPATTTVLLHDPDLLFDSARMDELDGLGSSLVLVAPTVDLLDRYAPGIALGGEADADGEVVADCDVPAAARAGQIVPGSASLQPSGTGDAADFCYPDQDGLAHLATATAPPSIGPDLPVAVLPDADSFDNESIATRGNAALALGLLGENQRLIWYHPTFADLPAGAPPTTAELTPEWVTPLMLTFLAVFVAAALWRGRRMGPLVVEDLPVQVPAGETIEGRARLYRRSSARGHSLDALRIGTVSRLAVLLKLPRTAPVETVLRATAALLGRPLPEIGELLIEREPRSDAALVEAANDLLRLESAVRDALRITPESPGARSTPGPEEWTP